MIQLLWKDFKTLQSLLIAVFAAMVLIHGLLLFNRSDAPDWIQVNLITWWFVLPNLFALGAPALLVGTEQDAGTLAWMRQLPIRWQSIVYSKLMVALTGLALTWIASNAILLIIASTLNVDVRTTFSDGFSYPIYFFTSSVVLLVCGFLTAFLFRSPIGGLLALIPAILLLWAGVIILLEWAAGRTGIDIRTLFDSEYLMLLFGVLLLLGLWLITLAFARRRLRTPGSDRLIDLVRFQGDSTNRFPTSIPMAQPTPTRALMWQSFQQQAFPCLVMLAICTLAIPAVFSSADPSGSPSSIFWELSALISGIAAFFVPCWLGVLVFYADTIGNRRCFFADRRIELGQIWWTRLVVPALSLTVLMLVGIAGRLVSVEFRDPNYRLIDESFPILLLTIPFAFGVLASQWVGRPVLAFLVAPVLVTFFAARVSWHPSFGTRELVWGYLLVTLTILAGARLQMRVWMNGEYGYRHHLTFVAIIVVASMVPLVFTYGI